MATVITLYLIALVQIFIGWGLLRLFRKDPESVGICVMYVFNIVFFIIVIICAATQLDKLLS